MISALRGVALAAMLAAPPVLALEPLTYLTPAPSFLPAFAPQQIAKARGYYEAEGLDVSFAAGKGGADAAKQAAVGNADLAGALIDTVMVVRANGLPVKGVANLGTGAFYQLVARKDAGVAKLEDLAGKRVGVIGYQDTGYFNLRGALSTVGLSENDMEVQAVGVGGVVQLMISGDLDAMVGVPEFTYAVEQAGIPVDTYLISDFFPGQAQVAVASETMIAEHPEKVAGFVRATLRAIRDIVADPAAAAADFAAAVPQQAGKEAELTEIFSRYASLVYDDGKGGALGAFEPGDIERMADFYVEAGILPEGLDAADSFTNAFVDE
jgi:NitT/TauT family transport system substrate-binding protein